MPSTGISRAMVYGAAPVGLFLLMVYSIKNLVVGITTKNLDKKELEVNES